MIAITRFQIIFTLGEKLSILIGEDKIDFRNSVKG